MKNKSAVMESFSMVLQISINMLVPIIMCTLFGVWIGDKYHMDWIVIPLFLVGALSGFTSVYKMVKKFCKNKDTRTKKEENAKKN